MPRWPAGGRATCESCASIDVRRWHRERRLQPGQFFSCSWSYGGAPSGAISVRSDADAVVLVYRARGLLTEWEDIEQRVPITWTACHFGGQRPWFVCSVYRNGHIADAVLRCCTRAVSYLPAAGVTVWLMQANKKRRYTAAWAVRKRSG
jgi:hypothetical protein